MLERPQCTSKGLHNVTFFPRKEELIGELEDLDGKKSPLIVGKRTLSLG
jgi:hypothetical protein